MLNKILLFLFISIGLNAQEEKRLALVIGNANYEKGELKNPVNDARLIASTLDSLGFDVILRENLSTKRDMTAAIREFGSKRSEYDVAFVYYAGHGIQVDDENFLLPTKEVFEEEFDVMDYGVSVQNIMRYLRAQTNEVNILILDACRDNPFESKWNTTRSLKGGGLAKIPAPTGSLIAFSTDSGQTAPDGDGENSVYTMSLTNNMLLKNTSIDQVFRNVRAEVLAQTDGMQRPVEATQLTGQTFYLKKPSLEFNLKLFNEKILEKDFNIAEKLINQMKVEFSKNALIFAKSGHLNIIKGEYLKALDDYVNAYIINKNLREIYSYSIWHDDDGESIGTGLDEILLNWSIIETQNKDKNSFIKLKDIQINNFDGLLDLLIEFQKTDKFNPMISYSLAQIDEFYDTDNEFFNKINMRFLQAKNNVENFKDYEKDHHLIKTDLKIDHNEWLNIKYADFLIYHSKFDDASFYLSETLNLMEENKSKVGEPYVIQRMGMIEMYKKNFVKAIEYFEKALILKNDYYNVMSDLAFSYYRTGNNINASKYYAKLIQNNPKEPFFLLRASLYNFSIGNYLKSYEYITLAREIEYQYDAVVQLLYMMINNKLNLSETSCDNIDFNDYVNMGWIFEDYIFFNKDYNALKTFCN